MNYFLLPNKKKAIRYAAGLVLSFLFVAGSGNAQNISGTVYNDVNGLLGTPVNTVDGAPLGNPGGTVLYANLLNAAGTTVIATSVVNASTGGYSFGVTANTNYQVQISTTQGTAGSSTPATTLPGGWVNTGDVNPGDLPATAATPGISAVIEVLTGNVSSVNFGIEQRPSAGNGTNTAPNPNGTVQVTVPANTFTNTIASTDPVTNTVASIRIIAFPTGVNTLVVNGISYTSATFPAAGVSVPTAASGSPIQTITVDPIMNGATTVVIPFKAVDAAGIESTNTGSAILGLTTTTPIYPCATKELTTGPNFIFTPTGTRTVTSFNQNGWVGAGSGAADAASTYTYIHDNVNTQTFTHSFIGVNPLGSGAVISIDLGIRNGIENCGGFCSITDWGEDATLYIKYGSVTYASVTTDGTTGSEGHIATIVYSNGATGSLPDNYTFDYGPTPQSFNNMNLVDWKIYLPTTIPNNSDLVLEFDPTGTASSDAADDFKIGAVSLKACPLSITGNVFNDVDGLTDNAVDNNGGLQPGSTTPTGLTANLFNATTGAFVATVSVIDGIYTFPDVIQNTNYLVIISTVAATAANTSTTFPSTLPTGWINMGDVNPTDPLATNLTPGISSVIEVATNNTSNVNFSIEQLPSAITTTMPSQVNNQAAYSIAVPANQFGGTDLSGGSITTIRFTSFPTNTASITINGIKYGAGFTPWPSGGVTVPASTSGQPLVPVAIDPVNGVINAVISYVTIDNAGAQSQLATITVPFTIILPVTFGDITATSNNCNISLAFETLSEQNTKQFEIEHSPDGITWTVVAILGTKGNSTAKQVYQYAHTGAATGTGYYRVKQLDLDGSIQYSSTVTITNNCTTRGGYMVFPNPVKDILNIVLPENTDAILLIRLTTADGRLVRGGTISNGNRGSFDASSILPGLYLLQVIKGNRVLYNQKIIKL
ncbi:MAG: T9SS type A sorting domain-containing protein [Bacteroidota bacterium]